MEPDANQQTKADRNDGDRPNKKRKVRTSPSLEGRGKPKYLQAKEGNFVSGNGKKQREGGKESRPLRGNYYPWINVTVSGQVSPQEGWQRALAGDQAKPYG